MSTADKLAATPAPAQAQQTAEYQGVRCMCVLTGCKAGPGCPHYCGHCRAHIAWAASTGGGK